MGRHVRKSKGLTQASDGKKAPAAGRGKRRIVSLEPSRSPIQLKTRRLAVERPENSALPATSGNSTCDRIISGHVLASCCSSTRSSERDKKSTEFADLVYQVHQENEEATVEFLASSAGPLVDFRDWREKTPSSEVQTESRAMPLDSDTCRRSVPEKVPPEAEVEEFFAAAEANLQNQFFDKYNYDIVKDEPFKGRYEWIQIQLKPR